MSAPVPAQTTDLDPACIHLLLNTVRAALPVPPSGAPTMQPEVAEDEQEARGWAATRLPDHLCPANPIEAMLAAHVAVSHFRAMDADRRATDPDLPNQTVHRLRGGARSLVRLALDGMRLIERRRSQGRRRVRSSDVLARAARGADQGRAQSPPRPETPPQRETARDPMHQFEAAAQADTVPRQAVVTAGTSAPSQCGTPYTRTPRLIRWRPRRHNAIHRASPPGGPPNASAACRMTRLPRVLRVSPTTPCRR